MKIIKLTAGSAEATIKQAVEVLRHGGLVVYPTETVYGVGVDATNPIAVEKLLQYKSRREGKPLSIAVADQQMAEQYVQLTEQANQLYQQFLPGPYTIISRGSGRVAPGVESEFGTLGIRISDYPLVIQLVKKLDKPITATSANASGRKRPYALADIFDHLSAKQKSLIELVIDAGELPRNEPSTIIDTTLSTPLTVRGKQNEKDQVFTTFSDQETRELAGKLMLKYWDQIGKKGLLIGLNGELGAGKTVFTQGIGQFLKIAEPITSPTYTYLHEYDFSRHGTRGKLYHLDMWKIDTSADFRQLQMEQLLKPGNVVTVEWWQQVMDFWPNEPNLLLTITEIDEESRKITLKERSLNV
ncbi:MAG: L-threonylcarbamoyladenylate synthase [Candidatus Paceibacterota bacterium]